MVSNHSHDAAQGERQTERTDEALRNSECLAYIAPAVCITLMMGSMGIVHNLYAKYFGIGLTTIAAILLFARIFDVGIALSVPKRFHPGLKV